MPSPKNRLVFLPLCAAAGLLAPIAIAHAQAPPAPIGATTAMTADVETIRQRRYAAEIASDAKAMRAIVEDAPKFLAGLDQDGSWPDVDYTDQTRSTWKTSAHLDRVLVLVKAYKTLGQPLFGSTAVKEKALLSLDYWLKHDFQNPNWWHNMIGVPLKLGSIMILLQGETSPGQVEKAIAILARPELGKVTGANLSWYARIQITRGCLTKSPDLLAQAYQAVWKEIRIARQPQDGIQADFSFHQHGTVLYNGGYGAGFMKDCVQFVADARGTQFAIPPGPLQVLNSYVLDGQQWMIRGVFFDYGTVGREITRATGDGDMSFMSHIAETLAQEPGARQSEMAAYATRLKARPGGGPLDGNRHFYDSDFMVHERPGYYASARMYSTRNFNTDGFINGEGKKSHYIADGATFIFERGDEYKNIFPVWDWRRVPGATIEQDPTPLNPAKVHLKGTTSFVGGVSDGKYGAAAMDLAHDELTGHKAWFYFDDEFVCLGAFISCPTDNPVLTSVNQCLLNGDVAVSDQSSALPKGSHALTNARWVLHDGIGYIFPDRMASHITTQTPATTLHVANQSQSGKWTDIGTGSPELVTKDVFSLWIDHGARPSGASYEYMVVPNTSAAALTARTAASDHPAVETLSNTPRLQAVRHNGTKILEAAIWNPGSLRAGTGWSLDVDAPCLVLVREIGDKVEVAVANPANLALSVNVTIDRSLEGDGCTPTSIGTRIHFDLPGGRYAGRSVVKMLSK